MREIAIAALMLSGCFNFDQLRLRVSDDLGVSNDSGGSADLAGADLVAAAVDLAGADLALGTGWKTVVGPTSQHLHGITGVGSKIWAVGAGGTAVHRPAAGANFVDQSQTLPAGVELRAVWAIDAQNLVVVGELGRAFRSSDGGQTWVDDGPTALTTHMLRAIWGEAPNQIYVAATREPNGDQGTILLRSGNNQWSKVHGPTTEPLQGIFGLQSTTVYASGGIQLVAGSGASWQNQSKTGLPTSGNNYWAIWLSAFDNMYIASDFPYRNDNTKWIKGNMSPPHNGSTDFYGVFGFANGDAYVVGAESKIYHRVTADDWVLEPRADGLTTATLDAVWGSSPADVWAVGFGGLILHRE
jgi:hypothetical protein